MYKGFAAGVVLFALIIAMMAGQMQNGTLAAPAPQPSVTGDRPVPATAMPAASMAFNQPLPDPGMAAQPMAGASAPTTLFGGDTPPPAPTATMTPQVPGAVEINPIPTGDKLPPGKVLTDTNQPDAG